jgi:hypothetical protein
MEILTFEAIPIKTPNNNDKIEAVMSVMVVGFDPKEIKSITLEA